MSKTKKLTAKKLDAEISRIYRVKAENKMINIMDIGKVYDAGRAAYAATGEVVAVENAIALAVERLCVPNHAGL